jgi:hypothetical protein
VIECADRVAQGRAIAVCELLGQRAMRASSFAVIALLVGSNARADPYVFDAVGVELWHFAAPSPASVARTTASPAAAGRRIAAYEERIGVGMSDGPYVAFDFGLGAFAAEPETFSATFVLASSGMQYRLGPVSVAAELTAGAAVSSEIAGVHTALVLDPRGRVGVAISPVLAIDGVAGASLVGDGWMAGIAVEIHSRPHR